MLGFKGLERPAVVLAVNGFRDEARAREMLYVGLSRARDLLVVCGDLELIRRVGGEAVARRLLDGDMPGDAMTRGGETIWDLVRQASEALPEPFSRGGVLAWGPAPVNDLERRFHPRHDRDLREGQAGDRVQRDPGSCRWSASLAVWPPLVDCSRHRWPSDGFTALWERGRLDLTVEAPRAERAVPRAVQRGRAREAAARLAAYRRSRG